MSGMPRKVTVTWMDGQQETYRCARAHVEEDVLWLTQDKYPATDEPVRSIPLANVRIWTVEDPW